MYAWAKVSSPASSWTTLDSPPFLLPFPFKCLHCFPHPIIYLISKFARAPIQAVASQGLPCDVFGRTPTPYYDRHAPTIDPSGESLGQGETQGTHGLTGINSNQDPGGHPPPDGGEGVAQRISSGHTAPLPTPPLPSQACNGGQGNPFLQSCSLVTWKHSVCTYIRVFAPKYFPFSVGRLPQSSMIGFQIFFSFRFFSGLFFNPPPLQCNFALHYLILPTTECTRAVSFGPNPPPGDHSLPPIPISGPHSAAKVSDVAVRFHCHRQPLFRSTMVNSLSTHFPSSGDL